MCITEHFIQDFCQLKDQKQNLRISNMKNNNQKPSSFATIVIVCVIIPFLLASCQSVDALLPSAQEPQETSIDLEMIMG